MHAKRHASWKATSRVPGGSHPMTATRREPIADLAWCASPGDAICSPMPDPSGTLFPGLALVRLARSLWLLAGRAGPHLFDGFFGKCRRLLARFLSLRDPRLVDRVPVFVEHADVLGHPMQHPARLSQALILKIDFQRTPA